MKTKSHKQSMLLYEKIASNFEHQINKEVLKLGDKLPSIRSVCRQYGVSMSTALQAYYSLESKSLIEARPQSGYYVSYSVKRWLTLPKPSQPNLATEALPVDEAVQKVYAGFASQHLTLFSLGVPSNEFLPIAKLNKGVVHSMRELHGSGTGYEVVEGNEKLRRLIALNSFQWGGKLTQNDIITTSGCSNALAYSLMAVTKRGDTIAVESPVFFGILQLARNLGLLVLELPTHPNSGIEVNAFKELLKTKKIAACVIMSNFNNPLGSCMPDEHKKAIVELAHQYKVPIIEDDIYGDVYFTSFRPKTCKSFDEEGWVLWCGSVSKTLAPGYRVGWVAPGRFYESIRKIKLFHSISNPTLTEAVVADFLENGRYENHLRKFRNTLYANCIQYIRAIQDYFPDDTKVSRPQGGFFLWIELNKRVNTLELFDIALRQKISFAPGRIFTLQNQFNSCMRLSYGLPWNNKLEQSLKVLGRLIRNF